MSKRMYVLVNEDLKMSRGKVAAQVAHAVARLFTCIEKQAYPETVIVLSATGEQIRNLNRYLTDKEIVSYMYIDEGVNEIPPYSITALAVEPLDEHRWDFGVYVDGIDFSRFPLLGDINKKKGLFR